MSRYPLRTRGFTTLEIMMVVAVIALLAALALPAFLKSRRNVQNTRFINDLRVATDSFEQHAIITGKFPPSAAPGVVPTGMDDYLVKMDWTISTPITGQWDWDNATIGTDEGVSVITTELDDDRAGEIDEEIDDGDIVTGLFQKRTDDTGFIYLTGN